MANTTKPDYRVAWSESGEVGTTPGVERIGAGWTAEVPPFQLFNWILERDGAFNKHLNEEGIAIWDDKTVYSKFGIVKDPIQRNKCFMRIAGDGTGGAVPSENPAVWESWPPLQESLD